MRANFLRLRPQLLSRLLLGMVVGFGLSACSAVSTSPRSLVGTLTPYKVEVAQGNFVSKEQVAQLQKGMPRQQVRELLGTSLLTDLFHSDRWDYVFTIQRQGVEPQRRHLAVFFKGDALDRFEGDEMPSEVEFVAAIDNKQQKRLFKSVPKLEMTPEELKNSEVAGAKSAPPAAPLAPLPASYPPLESGSR